MVRQAHPRREHVAVVRRVHLRGGGVVGVAAVQPGPGPPPSESECLLMQFSERGGPQYRLLKEVGLSRIPPARLVFNRQKADKIGNGLRPD